MRRAWPGGAEIRPLVGACALLAGCASTPEVRPASRVPAAAPRWAELEVARSWPLVASPVASRGHGVGHYLVEVRVTPETALGAYRRLAPGDALPGGTRIAAFHRSLDGGAAGSIYVMEKQAAGWTFLAADPAGRLLSGEGTKLCARCHAEGRADSLYGLPAAALAAPAGAP